MSTDIEQSSLQPNSIEANQVAYQLYKMYNNSIIYAMIYAFAGSCDEIKNCILCENGKFLVLEDDKYIKKEN